MEIELLNLLSSVPSYDPDAGSLVPDTDADDQIEAGLSFYLLLAASVLFLPAVFLSAIVWLIAFATKTDKVKRVAGVVFLVCLLALVAAAAVGLAVAG